MENVEELTGDMTGVWAVTTQGSTHIWNLNQRWYARQPGPDSKSVGIPESFNGSRQSLRHVEVWPKVGGTFLVTGLAGSRLDSPDWHRSSRIESISKIGD